MVGDDGGDGEGAGWWNPRVAEVLLLQVLEDAAGVDDAPMEVQPGLGTNKQTNKQTA